MYIIHYFKNDYLSVIHESKYYKQKKYSNISININIESNIINRFIKYFLCLSFKFDDIKQGGLQSFHTFKFLIDSQSDLLGAYDEFFCSILDKIKHKSFSRQTLKSIYHLKEICRFIDC